MLSTPLPGPLDVNGDIVVVVEWLGARLPIPCMPDRWAVERDEFCTHGWDAFHNDQRLATIGKAGFDWVALPDGDGSIERYPVLDWWPVAGVPIPAAEGDDLLVCYADGADRRVARLWPVAGRRGREQWGGFGGDVVDGLSEWGAGAAAGSSSVTVSRRDRPGMLGERCAVLGWARIGADVEALAREWRVGVEVIRDAAEVPEGEA